MHALLPPLAPSALLDPTNDAGTAIHQATTKTLTRQSIANPWAHHLAGAFTFNSFSEFL